METTTTKYWPDAKVERTYIGSFEHDGKCDFYASADIGTFVWGNNRSVDYLITVIENYAFKGYPVHAKAHALLQLHRARTPAPSAPAAMSRSEMIEKAAKAGWAQRDTGTSLEGPYRDEWYAEYEAALDAIGVLPPPPPPQKSVNEQVAEGMVKLTSDGKEIRFIHPIENSRIVLLRHITGVNMHSVNLMREYITAALDARDAEHRQAMGQKDWDMRAELTELREECATLAKGHSSADFIRRLPLTIAERSDAK